MNVDGIAFPKGNSTSLCGYLIFPLMQLVLLVDFILI